MTEVGHSRVPAVSTQGRGDVGDFGTPVTVALARVGQGARSVPWAGPPGVATAPAGSGVGESLSGEFPGQCQLQVVHVSSLWTVCHGLNSW